MYNFDVEKSHKNGNNIEANEVFIIFIFYQRWREEKNIPKMKFWILRSWECAKFIKLYSYVI